MKYRVVAIIDNEPSCYAVEVEAATEEEAEKTGMETIYDDMDKYEISYEDECNVHVSEPIITVEKE